MRRPAALLLIVALVAVALWATGVITVNVNPPKTEHASASPFWLEKNGEAQLPPPILSVPTQYVKRPLQRGLERDADVATSGLVPN